VLPLNLPMEFAHMYGDNANPQIAAMPYAQAGELQPVPAASVHMEEQVYVPGSESEETTSGEDASRCMRQPQVPHPEFEDADSRRYRGVCKKCESPSFATRLLFL
jgi:hypothetical protein